MKTIELSKRMLALTSFVTKGNRVCDVGCDHGYVPIYLVQQERSPFCLAMDVNAGPLQRAQEHIDQYGLNEKIVTRLSNGLSKYQPGEADTLILAGMGGKLMQEILEKEPEKTKSFSELILQPQSELPLFRKFLRKQGYFLADEAMILEDGKFYTVMKVSDRRKALEQEKVSQELQDYLGPWLLQKRHPVLYQYIERELAGKQELLTHLVNREENERNLARRKELLKEIAFLTEAKKQWDTENG